MIEGACLCGAVRFRINDASGELVFCHCAQCRKAQGVGFAANIPVDGANFLLTAGEDAVAAYRASEMKTRYFCRRCGSPIYSQVDGDHRLRIRAGSLDDAVVLTATAHIFADAPPSWSPITDALPRYATREPGR